MSGIESTMLSSIKTTDIPTPVLFPTSIKLEKFDALTEDTYETWARTAKANFVVGGYWPFFAGKQPKPKQGAEDWERFNLQLVAYLQTRIHPSLQHHLDDVETAEDAWETLRSKFREKGTVGQLNLLRTALRTRFTRESPKAIINNIHTLNGVIDRLFEIGVPSREEWKAMFFLHALGDDGEFEMMRETLETLLAAESLTSRKIIDRLEHEAQRMRGKAEEKMAQETAFAARTAQHKATKPKVEKPKAACTNCRYTNHTVENCYRPGGPMSRTSGKKKEPEKVNVAKSSSPAGSDSPSSEAAHMLMEDIMHISDYSLVAQANSPVNTKAGDEYIASATLFRSHLYHLDSATTSSCSPYREDFIELTSIKPRAIKGVNGSTIDAIGIGSIKIPVKKGQLLIHKNVLYVPQAALRLISVGRLADENMSITFEKEKCSVRNTSGGTVIEATHKDHGLYTIYGDHAHMDSAFLARAVPTIATWHKRLGHIGYQAIVDMARLKMAEGMSIDISVSPPTCEHCILGKQSKTPIPRVREGERAKVPLGIVYSDLTGPQDILSSGGAMYLMNIIDDYSSYPWGFTLKRKSDAAQVFKHWKDTLERETGHKIGIVRTDGGGEFTGSQYESMLKEEGIKHQTTAPYTSAQNGKSERLHRTIMGHARAMRLDADLPPSMWGECTIAAFYLAQRTPTRTLKGKTPYEALFG